MIVVLTEDIEYSVGPSVRVSLTAGMEITPISAYYLNREVEVTVPYSGLKMMVPSEYKTIYFFTYLRGTYFAIPKRSIIIPPSIGWRANV